MLTLDEDDLEQLGYGSPADAPDWAAWAAYRKAQQAEADRRYRATEEGKRAHREGMRRLRAARRKETKLKPGPKPSVPGWLKVMKRRENARRWAARKAKGRP